MQNSRPHILGRHWLIELQSCRPDLLQQTEGVERIMRQAAQMARAQVVSGHFHQFSPHGVSGVLVIQESHLAIHTWPEHGYAAVDIFTCSPDLHLPQAVAYLNLAFSAGQVHVQEIARGIR